MRVPAACERRDSGEIMQVEEKWASMMSEFGKHAKIPDFWRISALLKVCPKDVKEQMLMRPDEKRELGELPGEVGVVNDQEGRARKRRADRDASADGGGLRER